jgi:hypothetical protein
MRVLFAVFYSSIETVTAISDLLSQALRKNPSEEKLHETTGRFAHN